MNSRIPKLTQYLINDCGYLKRRHSFMGIPAELREIVVMVTSFQLPNLKPAAFIVLLCGRNTNPLLQGQGEKECKL